jgi:hypothetical protein
MTLGDSFLRGSLGHIIHHEQSLPRVLGVQMKKSSPSLEFSSRKERVDMAGPSEITSANRGLVTGDEPTPPPD